MAAPSPELLALCATLQEGLSRSKQGTYQRRMPAASAIPLIREALRGLRARVPAEPSPEAWRALALAEEALLHYPAALEALQKAVALSSPPDRKDLKRLIQLKENAARWESLGLTPPELSKLGSFLAAELEQSPCDHSHRHTQSWLNARGRTAAASTKALKAMIAIGGCCDCEVLLNVV